MFNLQVTVLWLSCEPQEQEWCSGEINCPQFPIFPRDRWDWALCFTGCHLAGVSKLLRGAGEITRHPPMWLGFESWHQCHVGWVCCWFSLSFSERLFSGFCSFHLSVKTNTFKNPIWSGMHGHVSTSWEQLRTPKCTVGKQITYFYNLMTYLTLSRVDNIDFSRFLKKSHSNKLLEQL